MDMIQLNNCDIWDHDIDFLINNTYLKKKIFPSLFIRNFKEKGWPSLF